MSRLRISLAALILVSLLNACNNGTVIDSNQASTPVSESTDNPSSLSEQQEDAELTKEEATIKSLFKQEQNFTIDIEDSRGDTYTLTSVDLYYRYYLNACRSGVISQSWEDANDIEPEYLINFFVSQANWNQTTYEDIDLPSKFLEPYISRYFTVEIERLRESMYYDISEDIYRLPIYPTEYSSRIAGASVNGDVLTINYEMLDWDDAGNSSIALEGTLEIEIESFPGYFRYLSNKFIDA